MADFRGRMIFEIVFIYSWDSGNRQRILVLLNGLRFPYGLEKKPSHYAAMNWDTGQRKHPGTVGHGTTSAVKHWVLDKAGPKKRDSENALGQWDMGQVGQ